MAEGVFSKFVFRSCLRTKTKMSSRVPKGSSGVKKLFVLALAQCSQEKFENVRQLWTALKIEAFKGTIATDLKLANIMVGI